MPRPRKRLEITTEGQSLFAKYVATKSVAKVAADVASAAGQPVSRQAAGRWLDGSAKPGREARKAICKVAKIDPAAWDRKPSGYVPPTRPAEVPISNPANVGADDCASEADTSDEPEGEPEGETAITSLSRAKQREAIEGGIRRNRLRAAELHAQDRPSDAANFERLVLAGQTALARLPEPEPERKDNDVDELWRRFEAFKVAAYEALFVRVPRATPGPLHGQQYYHYPRWPDSVERWGKLLEACSDLTGFEEKDRIAGKIEGVIECEELLARADDFHWELQYLDAPGQAAYREKYKAYVAEFERVAGHLYCV